MRDAAAAWLYISLPWLSDPWAHALVPSWPSPDKADSEVTAGYEQVD